jgi:hypothetical protein
LDAPHPNRLENAYVLEQLQGSLQVVQVTQVDIWRGNLVERRQDVRGLDPFTRQRIFKGLIGKILLRFIREQELNKL